MIRPHVQTSIDTILVELRQIRATSEAYYEALSRRPAVLREARALGLTWAMIGEALGISPQAAAKIR